MSSVTVTISPEANAAGQPIVLESCDVITALAVADINVTRGIAELHSGHHRLATLHKWGDAHFTFWELGRPRRALDA